MPNSGKSRPQGGETKIFWNEAERAKIVDRAIEILRSGLYDGPLHIFRLAMSVLPPERRRPVRTIADVPWFMDLVNETMARRANTDTLSDPSLPIIRELQVTLERHHRETLAEIRKLRDLISGPSEQVARRSWDNLLARKTT